VETYPASSESYTSETSATLAISYTLIPYPVSSTAAWTTSTAEGYPTTKVTVGTTSTKTTSTTEAASTSTQVPVTAAAVANAQGAGAVLAAAAIAIALI
jgi:hypothetical protein